MGYFIVCWKFSDRLIAASFPAHVTADFAHWGLPSPENVTLTNGSIRLAAWYFENPRRVGCGVVEIHGFGGNRAQVLVASPLFWLRGCDLLLYDLRSHGASSVSPLTYGVFDELDALVAVDWLSARMKLPHTSIGIIGWSYGAAVALQAAKARQDLAFVVADASFSSMRDIAADQAVKMYGRWAMVFIPGALAISGWRAGFDPAQASPVDAVKDLTTPVLLIHSVTDRFTPFWQSEKIDAYSDHDHTWLLPSRWGAPHAKSYETNPTEYTRWVDAFLTKFAPTFGSRDMGRR
ncbi:MAG: alpha/beta hydrolase [Gemmatimonadaceae bacterium]